MPWPAFDARRRQARDRAEEMRAHLEEYADQLVARGLTPEAARREARLTFGNPRVKLEEVEAMTRLAIVETLGRDVRDAARSLRRSPGFTTVVVAVLALGIGTATAIFSVVDAWVLRGLPFDEPNRLVDVTATQVSEGHARRSVPVPDAIDYRRLQDVFEGLAATTLWPVVPEEQPEALMGARVTADLFDVLRIEPQRGRRFNPSHELEGNQHVALLSDAFWRRRFGADPDVIGRRLRFTQGQPTVEVIGVMPVGFSYPLNLSASVDIWFPLVVSDEGSRTRRLGSVSLTGRLKPGVSLEQAQARMSQISASLALEHPEWFRDRGIRVQPLKSRVFGAERLRPWLLTLLAPVGCLVLLASVNVAGLLLTRVTARLAEARVRAALGATSWTLARAGLVEGFVLVFWGAVLSVLVAHSGVGLLKATIPVQGHLRDFVSVDARALAVTIGLATLIGVLVGVLPAGRLSRVRWAPNLRIGGRHQTPGRAEHRIRALLLTAETSIAVVLLVGAGLFTSSFLQVTGIDLGMDYRNVLTLPMRRESLDAAIEKISQVPGVDAVAAIDQNVPLGDGASRYSLRVPGRETPYWEEDAVRPHWVTSGYLDVLRLPLVRGRWLRPSDSTAADPAVVLSEEAAQRYFRDRNPLGAVVDMSGRKATVVGVVATVRVDGPEKEASPQIYFPLESKSANSVRLLVRTRNDAQSVAGPAVKNAIWALEPTMPLQPGLDTLANRLGAIVAPRRFNMVILSMFGGMGTIIAAIGLYGVMAFIVAQRTQEIGIRMALGAQPGRVRRAVLWQASRFLLMGLAVGLAAAAALAGRLEGLLFQVQPRDVVVYTGASIVLLAAGLAAAYLPARRASRVDPLIALRAE